MPGHDDRLFLEIELTWLAYRQPARAYLPELEVVSAEQNHRCCYCGVRTNEPRDRDDMPTRDHLIPRSRGGRDHYDNIVMACYGCNSDRRNMSVVHFLYPEDDECDSSPGSDASPP